MEIESVPFVTRMNRFNTCFLLVTMLTVHVEVSFFGVWVSINRDQLDTLYFGNWLFGMPSKTKHLIISGVAAICWAIWISRNDLVFDKTPMLTYLQVLFRATHWFRTWADLHKQEKGIQIKEACRRLECTTL
jgi:hypothetical protein